ncbi:DUF262 domain-containing protein [Lachnoanaerobaculum sp. Marseille-Q4761]|jgi:hypothetical protein|uniref:DUF262 domain-containing protein n=1 Tax=Lachnoanaerobaculum sp. Marseille-Q4761 TaxID=2819511 RepID=UPI001AA0BFFF|nr:DUF262 domain-containing protein [Lachnoanaerobaculum sp. Marseille-Q4761]MBO1871467.1 DUF262 domain-containing protein [Lachnoanaerobaculum sp. Marseille-Q4761]
MSDEKEMINYSAFRFMSEYKICIPIIQREYIQGCHDQRIINTTNKMIDDILTALRNERERVNLNIIYGYSENNVFFPIDGQQRLTLLYLIIYYCAVMGEKIEDFNSNIKSFSYETKDTSKRFFEVILNKAKDISEILNSGKDVVREMKSCLWFQVDWNNDVTINSVLSILKKLNDKIKKEEVKVFYNRLKDGQFVVFDICIERKEGAKLNSSTSYISLNARGKMLEDFENVKSLFEKIEITLGKKEKFFSDQYDRKYIDIFYKSVDSSKKLEDKTEEINQKSILFLLNSYNLVVNIFDDDINRKYVHNFENYYEKLYYFNKENKDVMGKYFDFIHKVLDELYKNPELIKVYPILESTWDEKQVPFFQGKNTFYTTEKGICDPKYAVIFLLYLFLNSNVSMESLKKLEHVLENIGYTSVRQENFDFAHYICNALRKEDIYEYFTKVMSIDDVTEDIRWGNSGKDLKCRLKEQIIKFKVIDYYNKNHDEQKWEFNFFEKYEKKYKYSNNGQLFYLLYITDLWDSEITEKKMDLLESYLSLNEKILFSSELIMKKFFAIATYYDDEKDDLFSAQAINEKCNYVYVRYEGERKITLSKDNLHKLESGLYTTNDNTEYGNDLNNKELKKIKLSIIKKVYDFLLNPNENYMEWIKKKLNADYNECWLKYAVDRKYTELLDNQLTYNNGKVYILIKNEMEKEDKVRFDTRVLLLDLKEEYKALEKYRSSVWSYDTKHVDSYKSEVGLTYGECNSDKNIINHFPVPIFNLIYRERYPKYKYKKSSWRRRCFFYFMNKIYLNFPKDTVYAIVNNEITLYQFGKDYEYIKFSYSLVDDLNRLKNAGSDFEDEVKKIIGDYQTFEDAHQESWSKSHYNYLGGIFKYGKILVMKSIDIKLFEKNGEGSLEKFQVLE